MSATPVVAVGVHELETQLLDRLAAISREFPRAAFASSLGAEDMVITDAILTAQLPIAIFTLDTGRLHDETLALIDEIRDRAIRTLRPVVR
jgi:phosphoadenosine phosphosulfate reductase